METFGCGKWEGRPHELKCLEASTSWDCADCNQRMNALCGITGSLGGEALFVMLTGGVAKWAGKGVVEYRSLSH